MKKISTTITIMMLMTLGIIITSCDNSDNIGDLYGQWKLNKIVYNGTETTTNTLFLNFQSQYVTTNESHPNQHHATVCYGHYTNKGGEMLMTFYYTDGTYPGPHSDTDPNNPAVPLQTFYFYDNGTQRTTEEQQLGIYPIHLHFTIETLNSNTMILHDKATPANTWYFSKN